MDTFNWKIKYINIYLDYERIIREQKIKAQLSKKTKETAHYLQHVEKDQKRERYITKKAEEGEIVESHAFKRNIPQKTAIEDENASLPKIKKIKS